MINAAGVQVNITHAHFHGAPAAAASGEGQTSPDNQNDKNSMNAHGHQQHPEVGNTHQSTTAIQHTPSGIQQPAPNQAPRTSGTLQQQPSAQESHSVLPPFGPPVISAVPQHAITSEKNASANARKSKDIEFEPPMPSKNIIPSPEQSATEPKLVPRIIPRSKRAQDIAAGLIFAGTHDLATSEDVDPFDTEEDAKLKKGFSNLRRNEGGQIILSEAELLKLLEQHKIPPQHQPTPYENFSKEADSMECFMKAQLNAANGLKVIDKQMKDNIAGAEHQRKPRVKAGNREEKKNTEKTQDDITPQKQRQQIAPAE